MTISRALHYYSIIQLLCLNTCMGTDKILPNPYSMLNKMPSMIELRCCNNSYFLFVFQIKNRQSEPSMLKSWFNEH